MNKMLRRIWQGCGLCLVLLFLFCLWPGMVEAAVTPGCGDRFAAGKEHWAALRIDDTVYMEGDNTFKQCDVPENTSNVRKIVAGEYHTLVLKADGTLLSWGAVDSGDYEVDYGQVSNTPTVGSYTAIAAGGYFSLALKEDGSIVAWGRNDKNQVSDVPTGDGYTVIAAGFDFGVAIRADGSIEVWGNDDKEQVSGAPADTDTDFKAIAAGYDHVLALRESGEVVAWGEGSSGECDVGGLANIRAIAAGKNYSVVRKTDNNGDIIGTGINVTGTIGEAYAITAAEGYFLTASQEGTIKVFEDGKSGKTISNSTINLLGYFANIIVEYGDFTPAFNSNSYTKSFTMSEPLPYRFNTFDVTVTLACPQQNLRIYASPKQGTYIAHESGKPRTCVLEVGYNKVCMGISGYGFSKDHFLYITREPAKVALTDVRTDFGEFNPYFMSDVLQYDVNVDSVKDNIDFTVTKANPGATVIAKIGETSYDLDEVPIDYGETPIKLLVEADEADPRTYNFNVKKAGFLSNLTASEGVFSGPFDPEDDFRYKFDPENFGYTLTVNSDVGSVDLIPTVLEPGHKIFFNNETQEHDSGQPKTIAVTKGDEPQVVTIEVKENSSAGLSRIYRVNINKVTQDDFVGSGTQGDPFLIYNLHALQEIACDDELLGIDFQPKYFKLACDIDASQTINWYNGAGFKPIGTEGKPFKGYFDGAGHVIKGLFINQEGEDDVGLFGCTNGGRIENLGLESCNYTGEKNVGALIGKNSNTYLSNCFSTGIIEGTSCVGGLLGDVSGPGETGYIENCFSKASVHGESTIGGLIGNFRSGGLKNCYACGVVDDDVLDSGGLLGKAVIHSCMVLNCYWDVETSGQAKSALSLASSEEGKTNAEMQDRGTYRLWFNQDWDIDGEINNGYPYLLVFENVLSSPIVDDSLVLWLEGEHGSNEDPNIEGLPTQKWLDLSGKANHGTLNDNFDWTKDSGWTGQSLRFDGEGDGATCPSVNIGDKDFTMEMFASRERVGGSGSLFAKLVKSGYIHSVKGFGLSHISDAYVNYTIANGKAPHSHNKSWCRLSPNTAPIFPISHLVMMRRGNTLYAYLNYGEVGGKKQTWSIPRNFGSFNNTGLIRIAEGYDTEVVSCRIYDRALEDAEIKQNHQAELKRQVALSGGDLAELSASQGQLSKVSASGYKLLLTDPTVENVTITASPGKGEETVSIDGKVFEVNGVYQATIAVPEDSTRVPIVVSNQGVPLGEYVLRIVKARYLNELRLDGVQLDNFFPQTLEYNVSVLDKPTVVIKAGIANDVVADLLINGWQRESGEEVTIQLTPGDYNKITVEVCGSGETTSYTLNVYSASPTDLEKLETSLGPVPGFKPNELGPYTLYLDEALDEIEITAKAFDPFATITIDDSSGGGEFTKRCDLVSGENKIKIKVGDGEDYVLKIIRPVTLSNLVLKEGEDASGTLISIKRKGSDGTGFCKSETQYRAEVSENVESVYVIATAAGDDVEVTINNVKCEERKIDLHSGLNNIRIQVKRGDISQLYELEVICDPKDATLSNLQIKHREKEIGSEYWGRAFNSSDTTYTINFDKAIDKIDITATPTDSKATVSLSELVKDDLVLWLDGRQWIAGAEARDWYDQSGNNNDGELHNFNGDSGWTGTGLEFDGVDDYVDTDFKFIGEDNFTIELYAKPQSGHGYLLCQWLNDQGVIIQNTDGNSLQVYINNDGCLSAGSSRWTLGDWHHIILTYHDGQGILYLDGEQMGNPINTDSPAWPDHNLRIGNNLSEERPYNGVISTVRIYNRALTEDEIRQNYEVIQQDPGNQTFTAVPLYPGQNKIAVNVLGSDGATPKTYNLTINRPGGLESLALEHCMITGSDVEGQDSFAKDVKLYEAESNVYVIKVTPVLESAAVNQRLFLQVDEEKEQCFSGVEQVLKLTEGENRVDIIVETNPDIPLYPNIAKEVIYILNVHVDPLVRGVGIGDLEGELEEITSVFGAQIRGQLNFRLNKGATGLRIKFDLPESLDIIGVTGLYDVASGNSLEYDAKIEQIVPEGMEDKMGHNVIKINDNLSEREYRVEFLLSNEPIRLKVGLGSFIDASGNELVCEAKPFEIAYVDFPKLD